MWERVFRESIVQKKISYQTWVLTTCWVREPSNACLGCAHPPKRKTMKAASPSNVRMAAIPMYKRPRTTRHRIECAAYTSKSTLVRRVERSTIHERHGHTCSFSSFASTSWLAPGFRCRNIQCTWTLTPPRSSKFSGRRMQVPF